MENPNEKKKITYRVERWKQFLKGNAIKTVDVDLHLWMYQTLWGWKNIDYMEFKRYDSLVM